MKMKKIYPAKELGFLLEETDEGWAVTVTPLDYYKKYGYFYDQHFRIKELLEWGIGDMEAVWFLEDKDPEEVRQQLLALGMTALKE